MPKPAAARIICLALAVAACAEDATLGDTSDTRVTPDAADTSLAETTVAHDTTDTSATPDTLDRTDTTVAPDTTDVQDTALVDTTPEVVAPADPIWDLAAIRDATTAACTYTNARQVFDDGVLLDVWDLAYTSWESVGGALQPITIRAFAARPATATGPLPGVVQAHGLGGYAEERHATGLAALLGTFVVAYTGPGGGTTPANTSEGLPSGHDDGRRMFDTVPDPRGAWFWGHAVAAMRALTCLADRPDVDAQRLGMTGFSAGAVATLTVAGVDDRVVAAVPLSGTLAWDVATTSPTAWQHNLLTLAGLDVASARWQALMALLDPAALLGHTTAHVLMVNGTTDEFFPLSAHVATFDAIATPTRRTSLAGNFDHGCYAVSGVESAEAIEARADRRARGGQRAWFGHWLGTDPRFATLPDAPTLALTAQGALVLALATVDEDAGDLAVAEVKLWWSGDDAFLWGANTLERLGPGQYGAALALPTTPLATYVDVEYTTGELIGATRFSLSSRPELPAGHVPHIRTMTTCL